MSCCGRPLPSALLACCLAVVLTTSAALAVPLFAGPASATNPATASAGAAGTAPGGSTAAGTAGDGSHTLAGDQPEPRDLQDGEQPAVDNTITRIELAADGSATWTLRIRTRLGTDTRATEYRTFQESFRENTSQYLGAFRRRMTGVVSNADETFPRKMGAAEFEASTSIQEVPQRWGVVTYEFTWDGFAAVEGDRIVVGDVFAGGFFIDEGDVLEVVVPPEYAIETADPTPTEARDGAVEWRGREDFADGRPSLVAVPSGEASGAAGGVDPLSPPVLGGAVLVLVVVAAGATHLRGGRRDPVGVVAARLGTGGDTGDGAGSSGAVPTSSVDAGPTTGSDGGPAETLLTDEDRVEALLAERGGRMKQGDIVDELGWSKSKGSRVLSEMAETGRIRKLRIGRENLIECQEGGAEGGADDDGGGRDDG